MAARLLFLVNDAGFFLSHRLPLALEAQRRGFEVHVATPDGPEVERIRAHHFRFHPVPIRRGVGGILAELRAVSAIRRIYRDVRPDIVHHIALKAMLLGGLAARATPGLGVVATLTGRGYLFTATTWRARAARAIALPLLRRALSLRRERVIFQNTDDLELFVSRRLVPADRAVLIRGSGVDVSRFQPTHEPEGPIHVVYAGRMLRDKGVEEFAAAAAMIRATHPNVRFRALGRIDADNPSAVSEAWMEKHVRAGVLEWTGHAGDMATELAGSHIVCLPSRIGEGVPMALLEAAASGRAIVTTDVPGCREVVRHGENGLLVPPGDAGGLAAALQTLIDYPELRRAMGAAGRLRACEEFALELVLNDTLGMYDALLADGRSRTRNTPMAVSDAGTEGGS